MPPLVVAFLLADFPFFSFCGRVFRRKSVRKAENSAVRLSRAPIFSLFSSVGRLCAFFLFFHEKRGGKRQFCLILRVGCVFFGKSIDFFFTIWYTDCIENG